MNRTRSFRPILFAALPLLAAAPLLAQKPAYPESAVREVIDRYPNGVSVTDPYRWLEDQEAPETRAWIDGQNAFHGRVMAEVSGEEVIAERLGQLLMVDAQGSPTIVGGRYFFTRRRAGEDLFAIHMREGRDGADVALVDPNLLATEVPASVGLLDVSDDGRTLAYGIRRGGQDEIMVRFLDVDARRAVGTPLERARYFGLSFTPDGRAFYFTRYGEEGPRVHRRELTGEAGSETLVFGEGLGPEKIAFAALSTDGRWMLVTVSEGTSGGNDVYLMDVARGGAPVTLVAGTGKNYAASFAGDRVVVQTDEGAPNGRVFVADPERPAREQWREIVPEGEHPIQYVSLAGGRVWVGYLENVLTRARSFDLEGKPLGELELPGVGSFGGPFGRFEQDEAFYVFTSYDVPSTTYRYSVSTGESDVWARQAVDFDSDAFEVRQVWYTSKDGTRVPMFVAHRTGLRMDGTNPTYLTGYGGFNSSSTPGFSAQHAVWLERGGVLAVPNLRGGGEFGEAWHRAGMFENKQNVFDDFIAAAEYLIREGYTSPERLAIGGGSNGGLLVGAALTQRPELFRAVLCQVPLLDMLRYENFLVGRYWVSEYGTAQDPEHFGYLRAYSPYHNVREGTAYPAVLFQTGDGDTRVAPLHARKMTALLQRATSSDRPILLRYDTEAGHSGGLPVRKTIEDTTGSLAFVMWQLGMPLAPRTSR